MRTIILSSLIIVCIGCQRTNPFIGTWQGDVGEGFVYDYAIFGHEPQFTGIQTDLHLGVHPIPKRTLKGVSYFTRAEVRNYKIIDHEHIKITNAIFKYEIDNHKLTLTALSDLTTQTYYWQGKAFSNPAPTRKKNKAPAKPP